MQILHTIIAVLILIMAAYFAGLTFISMFIPRAELKPQIASAAAAAGLALAGLYVLHW